MAKTKPYKKNPFRQVASAVNDNQPGGGKGGVKTPFIAGNGGLSGATPKVITTEGVSGGYTKNYILTEPIPDNDNRRRRR